MKTQELGKALKDSLLTRNEAKAALNKAIRAIMESPFKGEDLALMASGEFMQQIAEEKRAAQSVLLACKKIGDILLSFLEEECFGDRALLQESRERLISGASFAMLQQDDFYYEEKRMIKLSLVDFEEFQVLRIEIEGGVASPEEMADLSLPKGIDCSKGVVIEGRAPLWLYCFLSHELHPTSWVSTYDPRLGGGVVTSTHNKNWKIGQLIEVELPETIILNLL